MKSWCQNVSLFINDNYNGSIFFGKSLLMLELIIIRSPRLGLPDELLRALGDGRGSGTSEGDALAAAEEVPLCPYS